MALRLKMVGTGSGVGSVTDHNDLINKGIHTHEEIDKYLKEVDDARGNFPDLNTRIEKGGSESPETSREVIEARVDKLGTSYPTLKARLDATQGTGGSSPGSTVFDHVESPANTRLGTQRVFTVPVHEPGSDVLEVYVEGVLVSRLSDYVEIDSATIKFNYDIPSTVSLIFRNSAAPQEVISRLETNKGAVKGIEQELATARGRYPSLNDRMNGLTGGAIPKVSQIDKIGISATPSAPYVLEIPVPKTLDYKLLPAHVLKFIPGDQSIVTTEQSFNNGDRSSFTADPQVNFDGQMSLNTVFQIDMAGSVLGEGTEWKAVINKSSYKFLEKIEVV